MANERQQAARPTHPDQRARLRPTREAAAVARHALPTEHAARCGVPREMEHAAKGGAMSGDPTIWDGVLARDSAQPKICRAKCEGYEFIRCELPLHEAGTQHECVFMMGVMVWGVPHAQAAPPATSAEVLKCLQ